MFNGFTLFLLAVIGAVAFFHYTQGFFSAAVSAIIAVLAAALAVSYHEQVALALAGLLGNWAHSAALLLLFCVIYLVPRTAMDSMVPGNVTLPAAIDKAGAAIMGIVAGVFAAGVIAMAGQQMPVGPSVMGYSRLTVEARETTVPTQSRALDRPLHNMMLASSLDTTSPEEKQALVVPVDDILLDTVKRLSEGGSLSGQTPLTNVHPDWLTELFGQRVGIEPGGKRVAKPEDGELVGLYTLPVVQQRDHEFASFPRGWPGGKLPPTFPPNPTTAPAAGAAAPGGARSAAATAAATGKPMLVVARVKFKRSAADKDRLVRFSPGSVRLVAKKGMGDDADWANYFPIGTLDPRTRTLYRNRPDDYLFLDEGAEPTGEKGVDLVFYVDRSAFVGDPKDPKAAPKFADGSFLEIKRELRFPLGGEEVLSGAAALKKFPPTPDIQVLRKPLVVKPPEPPAPEPAPTPAPTPEPSTAPAGTAPPTDPAKPLTPENSSVLDVRDVKPNNRFFTNVSVILRGVGQTAQIPGGEAMAQNKKLTYIKVAPTDVTQLRGDIIEMFVPEGQVMVQVEAEATNAPFAQAWAWWQRVGEMGLKDEQGKVHKLVGAWASFETAGATYLTGAFQSDPAQPLAMPELPTPQARPGRIFLAAYVPRGTTIKEVVMGSEVLKSGLNVVAQ